MLIVETCDALAQALEPWVAGERPYAFVPTMGALHEGHLTLIREARARYPHVVASVFVNPTQFDRAGDLAAYPRQPSRDADLLAAVGTDLLFLPSSTEIYAPDYQTPALPDLDGLDTRYEGERRPGHFAGVVQVVRRLVELVRPAAMYLGEKDAQQVAVLRRAAAVEGWPLEIVTVATVREPSGLAMSSRNGRLSAAGFAKAHLLHGAMVSARSAWRAGRSAGDISAEGMAVLRAGGFEPEYFDLVEPHSFKTVEGSATSIAAADAPFANRPAPPPLLIAVAWLEGVRLIDNLSF